MSAIGGSLFLQSAICQSLSSSSYCSPLLYPSQRKVVKKKRAWTISFFWNGERPFEEICPFRRRVVLLLGVSVLPFLQFREVAAREPVEEKTGTGIQESQGTKLKESYMDTSDAGAMVIEFQVPSAAEHDVDAPPKIKELEILSQQPKKSMGDAKETTGGNSFVSFLNGIGVIGSGVLGALFAASQQEKKALESTIDSVNLKFFKEFLRT